MEERSVEVRPRVTFGPTALVTPANAVTAARLVTAPLLLALILALGSSWTCFFLWGALTLTDGVDGWVARRQGTTRSGAFLDPLADKALLLGALLALVINGTFWWLPVSLILARELSMSWYRVQAGRRGKSVPARWPAKVKTLAQDVAVGLALLPPLAHDHAGALSGMLWLAVALTLASGLQYLAAERGARSP